MSEDSIEADNRSITIEKDAISSAIISGNGNKVVIYQYQLEHQSELEKSSQPEELGPNPYKGLLAFQSEDGDHYFGREKQIEKLWNLFRTLHENTTQSEPPLRLLPILGPSGCGKSSLARAGLIPELARRPLPGKSQARVPVLVPGTHPVEALAMVLARVATNDPIPVAKTKEFEQVLKESSNSNTNTIIYDGLRRVANVLPNITTSPLVVLVDQFEEVYSLCDDIKERQIFIENLIHAASDRAGYVSVIITLRSDFLGETQRHPDLNQVIAKQGAIVPAMSKEELRRAITKPAEIAGHPLDKAVVTLLLKDTQRREGALPLLQFALTRIWSGIRKGVKPIKTLEDIGGVGGALASEAQRIYQSLNDSEKQIARRVFLGLVQLGEGSSDTRRRASFNSLVSYKDKPEHVKKVIERFANPGARLITLSSEQESETAEVTHEALFANWGQMQEWLDSSRSDIRFQRRLDEAALHWDENGRPKGNLWRSPDLDLLKEYYQQKNDNLTPLQMEFFQASANAEEARKQAVIKAREDRKRQRQILIGILSTGLLCTTTTAGFAAYNWQSAEQRRIEQTAIAAKGLLSNYPLQGMVRAISAVGQSRSPLLTFPNQSLPQSIKDSIKDGLFSAVEISREKNLFQAHQDGVLSIAISRNGKTIISGGRDGTVRMWNLKGQLLAQPFKGHKDVVTSVAISRDGKTIISGGGDGTVRIWNLKGQLIAKPLEGHESGVESVAISGDGQTIISGGNDGIVRIWNRKGKLIAPPFKGHEGDVFSIAISWDGKTIISGSLDGTVRIWDRKGQLIAPPFKGHKSGVASVAISRDGKTIISGYDDGIVRIWNRKGKLIAPPFKGHQSPVFSVSISTNGKIIITGGGDGDIKMWDRNGQLLALPFKSDQGRVFSVEISRDGQTIVSGSEDGTVRIWDRNGQPSGQTYDIHQGKASSVIISANGQTILSIGYADIEILERKGESLLPFFKTDNSKISPRAISTDGRKIVSASKDGTVAIWDRKGQILASSLKGHKSPVTFVAISKDEKTVITASKDATITIWGRKDKTLIPLVLAFKAHETSIIESLAISADGKIIISGGGDGTVKIWNRKGQPLAPPLKGHQPPVTSVAISSDGQTILSTGLDGTVRTWKQNGKPLNQPFKGHKGRVESVAISRNGQTILSGGRDGTVRMWRRNGQSLGQPLKSHESSVESVVISGDGQTILSGGDDFVYDNVIHSTVRIWDIRLESWLQFACERLRHHPVFTNPVSEDEKEAKKTCEPYFN